jgi:hypothetical protein
MGFMGIFPGSAQSLISGKAQYHRPSRRRNIIASHRRRRRLDDETDRIDEHIRPVQDRRNLIGAVGVGPGQRWAVILKNVSFKAIQIHNFLEKIE